MAATTGISGDIIEAIARETGTPFKRIKRITDENKAIFQDASKRNPNIAYLLEATDGVFDGGNQPDAVLYWKGRQQCLRYDIASKAAIRQMLEDDGTDNECVVCFDDLPIREAITCAKCHSRLCPFCMVNLCLTDTAIEGILNKNFKVLYRCPECRSESYPDFRVMNYRVLDRLDEFSRRKQQAILFAKKNDPLYELKSMQWILQHPMKWFKVGSVVKLSLLQNKKQWNGRKARIIGEAVMKDDVVKWPVQLIGGGKETALIKQMNMLAGMGKESKKNKKNGKKYKKR